MFKESVGFIASIISTCSFVPQVIKIYRTKRVRDVSLSSFIAILSGGVLWSLYGLLIKSYAIFLTNSIISILAFMVVIAKIIFREVD